MLQSVPEKTALLHILLLGETKRGGIGDNF
jgi:hypothetical protein